MAFPILHRLLFGNDGAGPKLRSDILPTATADTPGAVTTGDGITNTSGKISIDLSPYAKKDELSSLIAASPTLANTVRVDADQSFTDSQKLRGQKNLGLIEAIDALITAYGGTVPTD